MLQCKHNYFLKKSTILLLASLVMVACSHQSTVKPSEGHIDAKEVDPKIKQSTAEAPIPKPVITSPVLPPPKPIKKAQTYSVVVNEVPVKEILFALARESNINVDIDPSIQGRATLNAVDQTLPAILERLSRQVDLTYRMEGNVLVVSPDQPVLRTYKIDYVNMNRDTEGFIGSATEIASTGRAASTNSSGANTTGSSGNVNNSSRTSVTSKTENHLWESLIQNIKDLLAETDKEIIVSRYGTVAETNAVQENAENSVTNSQQDTQQQLDEQRTEFKTLLAANVIANPETGVISVRATNRQHQKVQEFIDEVMGSAKKQVLVEATIVEVTLNDGYQAGIDWSRLGNSPTSSGFTFSQELNAENFTPGDINTRATSDNGGIVVGYFNPFSSLGNIAASINLLKQFGDTKVLSSPKLMVLNNQTAVLKVVDNLVYFTIEAQQSTVGGTVGGVLSTITTTPNTVAVGVVMSVTPQIDSTGDVNINVRPTVSSVISFKDDPNPSLSSIRPSRIPEIRVREMESILRISSGNTAVLGGLMQDAIQRNSQAVPGLSDVPGVGNVFKGRNDSNSKTELVIFLRPTVISNASLESDELSSYKKYLPAQQLQKTLEEAN